jgi:hypothetical protein
VAFARVVASGAFFPPQREVASLPARQEAAGARFTNSYVELSLCRIGSIGWMGREDFLLAAAASITTSPLRLRDGDIKIQLQQMNENSLHIHIMNIHTPIICCPRS